MGASESVPICAAGMSPVVPSEEVEVPLPMVLGGLKHPASPEVVKVTSLRHPLGIKRQPSQRSAPGCLEASACWSGSGSQAVPEGQRGAGCVEGGGAPEGEDKEDASGKPDAVDQPSAEVPHQRRGSLYVRRRLLVPQHALAAVKTPKGRFCCVSGSGMMLKSLMQGRKTDWKRARRAASQICRPDYSCREFYEDIIHAFPELDLYLAGDTTSGRGGEDEYQRTLGAMFSFFWLMRLPLDGSESFCYGLDESWKPRECPPDSSLEAQEEWAKRKAFHKDAEWASLHSLLVDAGLLASDDEVSSNVGRQKSFLVASKQRDDLARRHNTERILAMLVLTAIHDIMKTVPLLPTVSQKHGPFRGYQVGEVINDHDAALAYVLEFYPSLLPSFAGLPQEQRETIKFTQSKMEYNMGWLVQAEAPPGALLRKFKQVVSAGQAKPEDVAFYFTHWFTDLAGAEPHPQEGCEKFVLRFPKAVLNQFLLSFSIIQSIGLPWTTETRVLEDYLVWRWDNHQPPLGPAPHGAGAIAKMRLVTMSQGDSPRVLSCFDCLPPADRAVLSKELSLAGCRGQAFWREGCHHSGAFVSEGPAILVYYAPALMQKAGREDPLGAMRLLAEVFRQARNIWPLTAAAADDTVTVRIDTLKELYVSDIRRSQAAWVIEKMSSRDGAVRSVPGAEPCRDHASQRVLRFSSEPPEQYEPPKTEGSSRSTACTDSCE